MRRALLAISAAFLASPALSADLPTKKQAPPPPVLDKAYNWSGFHIGVNGGVDWTQSNVRTDPAFSSVGYFNPTSTPAVSAVGAQHPNASGFTGGIAAGYDWQLNRIVFGVASDFDYMGSKGTTTGTGVYPCCAPTTFTVKSTVATDWLATARARVGFLATPALLLYGTGGLAAGDVRGHFQFTDTFAGATESASLSGNRLGWTLGGGGEYAFTRNWSVSAEYLRVDLGKSSVSSDNLAVGNIRFPANVFTHSIDITADLLRVGLNYKF